MKKIAFAINVLLLLFATTTIISCCSKGKTGQSNETIDSTAVNQKKAEAFPSQLNIRYVDMDSITQNYNLAKDFTDIEIHAISKYETLRTSKAKELDDAAKKIAQKQQDNSYLRDAGYDVDKAQALYDADMKNLNQKQNEIVSSLEKYQLDEQQNHLKREQELKDSIESFVIDYNKTHKYDAIINKAAGIYFNPELDITKEIVDGLNARYNKIPATSKTADETTSATTK